MKKLLVVMFTSLLALTLLAQEDALVVVYEKELEGILTTSGDYFSHQELTAGHESLPIGSIVEFVNPVNNKKVELTINDRILDAEGIYWISGQGAKLLGIESIYPSKVLCNIIFKPEVKEVYEEITAFPEPQISYDNIETVSYENDPYEAAVSYEPSITYETPTPEPVIENINPQITNVSISPILEGLSENLEMALGDPRIPKSAYSHVYGYGVHIYTTLNSSEAIEVSQRLYNHFACPSYVEKYNSPLGNCYRVIAGDYSNESEALSWYNKLNSSIPGIFLVEIY